MSDSRSEYERDKAVKARLCKTCGVALDRHGEDFDCKKFTHGTESRPVLAITGKRDHVLFSIDGEEYAALSVQQYGTLNWSKGREAGQKDGIAAASAFLGQAASEAFLAGKDDLARVLRNHSVELSRLSVTYRAPTNEEIRSGEW